MKIKNIKYLLLSQILFLFTPPSLANNMDLLSVYQQGMRNNFDVNIANQELITTKEQVPLSYSEYLPKANINGRYSYDMQDGTATEHQARYFPSKSAGLELLQPILNAPALYSIKQAYLSVDSSKTRLSSISQQVALRISESYFALLAAEENMTVATAERNSYKQSYEQAKSSFEVRAATLADKMEAKSRLDIAIANELSARAAVDIAHETLVNIVGEIPKSIAKLKQNSKLPEVENGSMDIWIEKSIQNNLETKLGTQAIDLANMEISKNRAGHLPSLNLIANYTYSDTSNFFFGQREFTSRDGSVAVQLNIPIFNGGYTLAKTKEAVAIKNTQKTRLLKVKASIALESKRAYLNLVNGLPNIKALQEALNSSENVLETTKEGFKAGIRTRLDILNAQQQLFSTKRDLALAKYEYIINYLRLKFYAGELEGNEINSINALLNN